MTTLLKTWRQSFAAVLAAAVFAVSGLIAQAAGTEPQDAAKMYLVKHSAQIHLVEGTVALDGQTVGKERIPMKNGRLFVPARMLEQLGIATVQWKPEKREAVISVRPELRAPVDTVVFRVGDKRVYGEDGTAFPNVTTAAPFVQGGKTYVPVQHFAMLGVNVEMEKPYLHFRWSEKLMEVYTPVIVSEEPEVRFTVLYESDISDPMALASMGPGGWYGSSENRKIVGRDISLDGRTYKRMQFKLPLQPGVNPILLSGVSFGDTVIETVWEPERPEDVPFVASEYEPVTFREPQYGFVQVQEGSDVAIAGEVTIDNVLMDEIKVYLEQYDPEAKTFVTVGEAFAIPIRDQQFAGKIPAPEAGMYVVRIISPEYIPYIGGPVATTWGKFVLDVKPE